MPASVVASAVGAGGSLLGGLVSKNSSQTQTSTPTLDPAFQGLQGQILNMVQQRLSTPTDLAGYTAGGVSQINSGFNQQKQASDNDLTARGLATSPVAANVDATRQNARTSAVTSFRNSVPLIARNLQDQDLGLATNVLGLGRGVSSAGTQCSGGGAAGGFTNLAQYIGYMTGKGAFSGSPGGLYPVGGNGTNYAPSPDYGEGY